jgi:hypothetical protein
VDGETFNEPDKSIALEAEADEAKDGSVTPLRALRRHCLWCCNGNPNEVRLCVSKSCPLWPFRFGHRPTDELKAEVGDRILHPAERQITGKAFHDAGGTALRAIRLRCLDCRGASRSEVAGCWDTDCALDPFRFGKNPNFKLSDERKEAMAAISKLARDALAKKRALLETSKQRRDPGANS